MGLPRRAALPVLALLLGWVSVYSIGHVDRTGAESLPARLSDRDFWRLSVELSEPAGYFRSDNLVSNEHTFQYVVPDLRASVPPGGVYLGVAPDQNFTYIVATRPAMAFIVDVRRGNLLIHLMYKALFELSADRAEFVSRLFSKTRPEGLGPDSSAAEVFAAFARVEMTAEAYEAAYRGNLQAIREHLVKTRGLPLSAADLTGLEQIYYAFYWDGPGLRYSSSSRGGSWRGTRFPSYQDLVLQTDWDGEPRSYLATESSFRFVKAMHVKNLIVPVVGNFAGPKALRAVGGWVRRHDAAVTAFYVSNVEQYLFQDGLWDRFARNVATLPLDPDSVFIRSVSNRFGHRGRRLGPDGRATVLDPIPALLEDFQAGLVHTYYDVNVRPR